jgi:hypothetical protein
LALANPLLVATPRTTVLLRFKERYAKGEIDSTEFTERKKLPQIDPVTLVAPSGKIVAPAGDCMPGCVSYSAMTLVQSPLPQEIVWLWRRLNSYLEKLE